MIPFMIYMFFKKNKKNKWAGIVLQISKFLSARFYIIFLSLLIMLLFLIPFVSISQKQLLNYKIIQGGNEIGWLQLEKNIDGNTSTLLMISEIKTRLIFPINVSIKESSFYENGKLIYSSQFRKTNGNTKLDKQTKYVSNKYEVLENGDKETLSIPFISTNLLSLYFREPAGIDLVYCDNHKCFVKITKKEDGGYKLKFPDGNSDCFYYSGGICSKIKIEHTFYSAEIVFTP